MKAKWIAVGMGLAVGLTLGVFQARAVHEVSASVEIRAEADFYSPLEAHGGWIEVDSYGRCWHPTHVEATWRPYCHGSWVWTDCGWYWVSDEPWAWACYHYGRWVYHPRLAWVWVPGIEWGPAWVSWRVGGGFVGWAPLPPRVDFGHDEVIVAAHVNLAPERFVFVESGRFHERISPATVIVNNRTVVEKTTLVTNIRRADKVIAGAPAHKVVVNEGPGLSAMQKATSQKVRTAEIREVVRQTPQPATVGRADKRTAESRADGVSDRPDKGNGPAEGDVGRSGGRRPDDDTSSPGGRKRSGEGHGKGKGPKKD